MSLHLNVTQAYRMLRPVMTQDQLALQFATLAHAGVDRPNAGGPYIRHPVRVAELVSQFSGDPAMLAAAYLHDVPEDVSLDRIVQIARDLGFQVQGTATGVFLIDRATKLRIMRDVFGDRVAYLLECVTKITTKADGDRNQRLMIELDHMAEADADGQTLKVADIWANLTNGILSMPQVWARRWVGEKKQNLRVLVQADPRLRDLAAHEIKVFEAVRADA